MNAKKAVLALLVVMLGYWMFNDPQGLADVARTGGSEGWGGLSNAFEAIIAFVGEF